MLAWAAARAASARVPMNRARKRWLSLAAMGFAEDDVRAIDYRCSVALRGMALTASLVLACTGLAWAQCDDGIDNDGDGLVDWEYDLGCYSASDTTEGALTREQENGWTTIDPAQGGERMRGRG